MLICGIFCSAFAVRRAVFVGGTLRIQLKVSTFVFFSCVVYVAMRMQIGFLPGIPRDRDFSNVLSDGSMHIESTIIEQLLATWLTCCRPRLNLSFYEFPCSPFKLLKSCRHHILFDYGSRVGGKILKTLLSCKYTFLCPNK